LAKYTEKAKHLKIKSKWPITIVTEQGGIDGELRMVTDAGIFIHCDKPLRNNETYRIVIRPSPKLSVELKGKLILSNPDSNDYRSNLSGMTLSFVKISEGYHGRLRSLSSAMEVDQMEAVKNVKMKLRIETDRRIVEKKFSNLFDLRVFMESFFSLPDVAERRTTQPFVRYTGRERRMWV
jgi:hypothetical protein